MAFDFLSISAMSSKTERVFSQAKHTISDTRCRLGAVIMEAIEYDRHWMRTRLGATVGALSRYLTEYSIKKGTLWAPQGRILEP